jgi:hypothetical protein
MPLVLDGTNGVSGVNGSASSPAFEGTDADSGIFINSANEVNASLNSTPVWSAVSTFGFKNRIINGAMNIFQRNTTLSVNNTQGYSVDRMWGFASLTAATYTQVSSNDLAGFPFAIRSQRTAGNTGTNGMFMGQIIESNNLQDLQGQSVTVSFWARAGANYSATGSTLYATIRTGTVADQGLNILISPGWTGATTQSQTVTLTTSWQYFTKTYTIPTTAQELSAFFEAYPTGTAGANDFFDITGFQLEKGSTATSFDYRPYGTELALCQRYYFKITGGATTSSPLGVGFCDTTTVAVVATYFPVAMRTDPTAVETTGTAGDYRVRRASTSTVCSVVPAFFSTTTNSAATSFTVASGLSAGAGVFGATVTANTGFLAWSAEL